MLIPLMTLLLMMSCKLDCRSQKQKWSNQRQCLIPGLVIGLFFRFFFQLWKSSFHWNIVNGVINRMGRNSVGLLTPLMTPIFDFDWVINTLMTPTTTLTLTPLDYKQSLFFLSPLNKTRENAHVHDWRREMEKALFSSQPAALVSCISWLRTLSHG